MSRKSTIALAFVLAFLPGSQGAFAWGSLTHAFITNQIASGSESSRQNAIYGSTAPDFANYMFGSHYQMYLMDRTHVDYVRVWKMARGGPAHQLEQAVAFGFVAHNEEDYTAHSGSITLDPGSGYVIQKAAILNAMLGDAWQQLGLDGEQYAALRAELSHEVIEFAGDFFVYAYLDPASGKLLSDSAAGCNKDFPALLTKAYAGNLVAFSNRNKIRLNQPEAASIITGSEFMFRAGMISYGNLFTGTNPEEVFNNLVYYLQGMAALQGIQIDDPDLVAQVLGAALFVIQDGFADEVLATVPFTAGELAEQKVAY